MVPNKILGQSLKRVTICYILCFAVTCTPVKCDVQLFVLLQSVQPLPKF